MMSSLDSMMFGGSREKPLEIWVESWEQGACD